MGSSEAIPGGLQSAFKNETITWHHLTGGPQFDYPIDYWIAVLGARPESGQIDFLVKWEPNAYCHFHRHLGDTTTLVIEGEHHIVDTTPTETVHKTRLAGHFARSAAGDLHMEYGGPEGSVLLFSMQSDDGRLFEIIDKDGKVLAVATVAGLAAGQLTG